ncbi:hypothetical protein EDD18DRAFT_454081 [Armillaria luteobubalina]|uniref:LysM domain-containing protein n=1 Tax=Armillaria luteobubalina TaxID=153913 RepID=A0AA39PY69_9AGAR|nr:hypothetical protein EDD18DRAFT_454081 [Armillaria luteobubalina]
MLFIASFALLLTILNRSAAQEDCFQGRDYTVIIGNTCDGICAALGVSIFQIAYANPGIDENCDNLQPGQVRGLIEHIQDCCLAVGFIKMLCLGTIDIDCTETHLVVQGDTCNSITDVEEIGLGVFMCNNGNINADCGNLDVETLYVLLLRI